MLPSAATGIDSSSAQPGQQPKNPPPCRLISTRSRLRGRHALLRQILERMHAADRRIAPLDGEKLALPREVAREQRRNAALLNQHLRALHVAQMFRDVVLPLAGQKRRKRHGVRGHLNGAVRRYRHTTLRERLSRAQRRRRSWPRPMASLAPHLLLPTLDSQWRTLALAAIVCTTEMVFSRHDDPPPNRIQDDRHRSPRRRARLDRFARLGGEPARRNHDARADPQDRDEARLRRQCGRAQPAHEPHTSFERRHPPRARARPSAHGPLLYGHAGSPAPTRSRSAATECICKRSCRRWTTGCRGSSQHAERTASS